MLLPLETNARNFLAEEQSNPRPGSIFLLDPMHAKFPVTIHLILARGNQVLLLKRFQTGYMDGFYSLPAGHLDGDETVRMAGVREAQEEIDVHIDPANLDFVGVFHRHEGDERVDFFFQARCWNGEPINAEPEKCSELCWSDLDDLPENIVPYIRQAINNFQTGIKFQEVGWN